MGCCGSDEEEQRQEAQPQRPRVRGCTDVFWLILFILFWFLLILIAAFAFVYGNPVRLINGYDSFGNTCGVDNNQKFGDMELSGQNTSDKPYLFFMDVTRIKQSLKICVKKCPDRKLNNFRDVCTFYSQTGSQLCHDKSGSDFTACKHIGDPRYQLGSCFNETGIKYPVYESIPILNRCIPKAVSEVTTGLASNLYGLLNSWDTIEQVLADLYKTWREILALSFLAFVFSLIMIAIFHLLASVVTCIVMILVVVACCTGTGLLWWTYFDIKKKLDGTNPETLLEESVRNEKFFYVLAIVASIITSILLIVLCIVRKKVSFMAELFRESAKCLAELPGLFFTPPLTFAALLIFFTYWITVILCLATANYPSTKVLSKYDSLYLNSSVSDKSIDKSLVLSNLPLGSIHSKTFTLVEFVDSTWVKYMWWVYIIGLIWVSEFITSCQTMVISGAVVHWYFEKNKTTSPVCSSVGKLVFYHLGSVACGSLLITIFKMPRLILTYIKEKFRLASGNSESARCTICGLNTCSCCLYCVERFIQYMSNNAYTVIAIEGCSFCTAAERAFSTITSNALQVAVINGIGDFILFLGKCIVTAATGSVALLFLRSDPKLNFFAVPVLVICIFAFFIAHCVISLYESIIDTLFLCICEDKYLYGENGKWCNSPLAKLGEATNSNGQHELAPMNK